MHLLHLLYSGSHKQKTDLLQAMRSADCSEPVKKQQGLKMEEVQTMSYDSLRRVVQGIF